jgi:DNA-binding HxlR family transcriptional regulator
MPSVPPLTTITRGWARWEVGWGVKSGTAHSFLLGKRPYRFNELQRGIETISQRMLTRTLRRLEADGLVHREVFPTIPPSVEYSLAPLGESLLGPLSALADWAVEHRAEIAATRVSN